MVSPEITYTNFTSKAAEIIAGDAQKFISQNSGKNSRIVKQQTSDLNHTLTKVDLDATFDAIFDTHRLNCQSNYLLDSKK